MRSSRTLGVTTTSGSTSGSMEHWPKPRPLIFEALNARNTPLSATDLVRHVRVKLSNVAAWSAIGRRLGDAQLSLISTQIE